MPPYLILNKKYIIIYIENKERMDLICSQNQNI